MIPRSHPLTHFSRLPKNSAITERVEFILQMTLVVAGMLAVCLLQQKDVIYGSWAALDYIIIQIIFFRVNN